MSKIDVRPIADHVADHRRKFDPYYENAETPAVPTVHAKLDAAKTARDSGKLDWATIQRYKLMGIKLPDSVVEEAEAQCRGEAPEHHDEDHH